MRLALVPTVILIGLVSAAAASIFSRWRRLELTYELFRAIYTRDMRSAELLVASGAEPNARFRFGTVPDRPDFRAYLRGIFTLVGPRRLPISDERSYTPLQWSAEMSASSCLVKSLLAHGADPNARTQFGMTALHKAVLSGQQDLIPLLIRGGADVNASMNDARRTTPLALAGRIAPGMAPALISAGADVDRGDALAQSCESGHLQTVVLLVRHRASARNLFNLPFFEDLAGRIDAPTMELFIEHGAGARGDVTIDTMLYDCVVQGGSLGTIRVLLRHGARVRRMDPEYGSALDWAVRLHRTDAVRLLSSVTHDPVRAQVVRLKEYSEDGAQDWRFPGKR